ncbi:MAG: 3-isopropylmalate dehydratase small subunit [Alphaproteobacteria bacterium]|jgi:3-isopropylmalate/(R)-2-methylmalate dehydratase small subunit
MPMRVFESGAFPAAPLDIANVDTDQLIPARFLKRPRDERYPEYLFYDVRRTEGGAQNPEFVLNRQPWDAAEIIVADRNFGCGSSREAAVYVLVDSGFRAVIAPSFGDIFYSNSMKNGFLPIRLSTEVCAALRRGLAEGQGGAIGIDLDAQTVIGPDGQSYSFDISPFNKHCLMNGLDDIGFTIEQKSAIEASDANRAAAMPWLKPATVI